MSDLLPCDTHVHLFPSKHEVPVPANRHPEAAATINDLRKVAEPHGVARFVLTQPSFLGFDNSIILSTIAADPDRLRGVIWMEPSTPPKQLHDLPAKGVAGLRFPLMFPTGQGAPLALAAAPPDWSACRELLQEAQRIGLHVELGMEGHLLQQAVEEISPTGVNIVIAHFGMFDRTLGPDADETFRFLLEAARSGHVWFKLSQSYRSQPGFIGRAFELLLEAAGPERLVWGSDWPHVGNRLDRLKTYPSAVQWIEKMISDSSLRRQIWCLNPAILYNY
ncbi:amidohydrolase family protein [Sinorhizobium medicae]